MLSSPPEDPAIGVRPTAADSHGLAGGDRAATGHAPASESRPGIARLSVVVPCFDEAPTVGDLLERVLATAPRLEPAELELLVVDDGSRDASAEAVEAVVRRYPGAAIRLLRHDRNRGKTGAIRTALSHLTGDVVLVQDADLEYDPADYPALLAPIAAGAPVVFGRRRFETGDRFRSPAVSAARGLLNKLFLGLYGVRLDDLSTGFKVFRTSVLRSLEIGSERFEFCAEASAKLARSGVPIVEVPVSYRPRSNADGKKIRAIDFFRLARVLVAERVAPPRGAGTGAEVAGATPPVAPTVPNPAVPPS